MRKWPGITAETCAYFSFCSVNNIEVCKRCGRSGSFADIMRDIINKHKRVDQDAMPVEARGTLAQLANYDAKHLAMHNDLYKPSCQRPCCGPWGRQECYLRPMKAASCTPGSCTNIKQVVKVDEETGYVHSDSENEIDAYGFQMDQWGNCVPPEYSSDDFPSQEEESDSTPTGWWEEENDPNNGGYTYCGEHYHGVWHGTAYAILKSDYPESD